MTETSASTTRVGAFLHDLRAPGWPVAVLPVVYTLIIAAIGDLRFEHVVGSIIIMALWVAGGRSRAILIASTPGLIVLIGFDSMRYLRPYFVTPEKVFGCELRNVDLALFGVTPNMTLADYFAVHHAPFFDFLFSIPYAAFVYVALGYGVLLFFRNRSRVELFGWSFAALYMIAIMVWLTFPAAPPWYIQAHGCAIDLSVGPTAGPALLRVDHALGISYFDAWYGRGPTAFGAMPSVHCAYPMIALLTAWRVVGWKERTAHVVWAVWMICASVYLDHHWLIDGLAGWLTAAVAVGIAGTALSWIHAKSPIDRKSPTTVEI